MGKKNKKDKKKRLYEPSPALMYTGLIPVLRKTIEFRGVETHATLWFDNVIVRNQFLAKTASLDDYTPDFIHLSTLSAPEYKMDLHTGRVVFKVGKKRVRAIPLLTLHWHYTQFGESVVDK